MQNCNIPSETINKLPSFLNLRSDEMATHTSKLPNIEMRMTRTRNDPIMIFKYMDKFEAGVSVTVCSKPEATWNFGISERESSEELGEFEEWIKDVVESTTKCTNVDDDDEECDCWNAIFLTIKKY